METIIFGALTSFLVVLFSTPSLIKVSKLKHLVDEPGEDRKLHERSIPTIGGIIIFAATLFAYALWFPSSEIGGAPAGQANILKGLQEFKFLVATLLILFFIGVKDDIIGTAPAKKMIAQFLVGFILVIVADIRIRGMHGIFGVYEIPYWASVFLSVFAYIVIVNAFNLIDGVDGLATGIGLINSVFFGTWFLYAEDMPLALLAFAMAGALLAFLIFNFSPAKVFMGDSGSLTTGLVLSFLAIRLIEHDMSAVPEWLEGVPTPVFAMATLSYPLIDTLRVFILRALKGRSPFEADNNHIHHRLLSLGLKHKGTVLVLYIFNILVVCSAFLFTGMSPTNVLLLTLPIAFFFVSIPYLFRPKTKAE